MAVGIFYERLGVCCLLCLIVDHPDQAEVRLHSSAALRPQTHLKALKELLQDQGVLTVT